MLRAICIALLLIVMVSPAFAQERSWRADIKPLIEDNCIDCHGADAPEYNDWRLLSSDQRKKVSPRMDTYPHFMSYVVWPATGALMRRLDDGKAGGKTGNMYQYLGDTEEKRANNLVIIKEWLGAEAWNLNRWKVRKETPGITKEQLESIKANY